MTSKGEDQLVQFVQVLILKAIKRFGYNNPKYIIYLFH